MLKIWGFRPENSKKTVFFTEMGKNVFDKWIYVYVYLQKQKSR